MAGIKITTETRKKGVLVVPTGEITFNTILELRPLLQGAIEKGGKALFLDLSMVSYMDSSGIGLLANVAKKLTTENGKLLIIGPTQEILDLLELASIEEGFIHIFETVEEAEEKF